MSEKKKKYGEKERILGTIAEGIFKRVDDFKQKKKRSEESKYMSRILESANEFRQKETDQVIAYLNSFDNKLHQLATTAEKYNYAQQKEFRIQTMISEAKAQHNGYKRKYYERLNKDVIQPRLDQILRQLENEKRFPEVVSVSNQVPIPIADAEPALEITTKQKPSVSNKILLNLEIGQLTAIFNLLVVKKRLEESDKELFIKACYNEAAQKLSWRGNANIWGTVLYDLKRTGCIKSKKNVIAMWMTKNFQYEDEGVVKNFDYESSYAVLNSSRSDKRVHSTKAHYINVLNLFK